MFKRRTEPSWRVLRLVTRLAFLPGVFVLLIAVFTLFSLLYSYSGHPSVNIQSTLDSVPPNSVPWPRNPPKPANDHDNHESLMDPNHSNSDQHSSSSSVESTSDFHVELSDPSTSSTELSPNRTNFKSTSKPLIVPVTPQTNAATPVSAPSCKWGKYANWPYTDEFHSLSPLRKKLLYIKTPKSSSSTIAHILQRYTTREGMVVGYPNFKHDQWTLETKEHYENALHRASVKKLDAIVSHIVYNNKLVENVLGTERPFRVTSLREPTARSWSMYLHGVEYNLAEFSLNAKDPWTFAKKLEADGQMAYITGWKLGIDSSDPEEVSKHFDHFVMSHRVVESIVALAPKLGLKASDLLFFSQKTNYHKKPSDVVNDAQKKEVDSLMEAKTRKDRKLFEIGNRRLDRELAALPTKVKGILGDVKQMKEEVKRKCAHIDPEDNSCVQRNPTITVWDGNQVCLARCIEQWARKHIHCQL